MITTEIDHLRFTTFMISLETEKKGLATVWVQVGSLDSFKRPMVCPQCANEYSLLEAVKTVYPGIAKDSYDLYFQIDFQPKPKVTSGRSGLISRY